MGRCAEDEGQHDHGTSPPLVASLADAPNRRRSAWVRRAGLVAGVLLWTAGVATGFWRRADYDNTPGRPADPPNRWPADSAIARTRGRFSLVMFAHPQCPCTRASIGELDAIMARTEGVP